MSFSWTGPPECGGAGRDPPFNGTEKGGPGRSALLSSGTKAVRRQLPVAEVTSTETPGPIVDEIETFFM